MALDESLKRVPTLRGIAAVGGLLLLTLFGAATPSSPADSATPPGQVHISNFTFDPPSLTVKPGATVSWVNKDDEIHTVTSADGGIHIAGPRTDESFSFRFDAPGTYRLPLRHTPAMTGTIVVR